MATYCTSAISRDATLAVVPESTAGDVDKVSIVSNSAHFEDSTSANSAHVGGMARFQTSVLQTPRSRIVDTVSQFDTETPRWHEVTTQKKYPIGTRIDTGDRIFVYASAAATDVASPGALMCPPVLNGATGAKVAIAIAADAAVGDYTVTLTNGGASAMAANTYSDGYMIVEDADTMQTATLCGYSYKIKTHPADTAVGNDGDVVFTLFDPLAGALTAVGTVSIVPNPYANLIMVPASATPGAAVVGVSCANVVSSTLVQYFWVQVGGMSSVKMENVTTVQGNVIFGPGQTTAGCATIYPGGNDDSSFVRIGVSCVGVATGAIDEAEPTWLTMDIGGFGL